MFSGFASLAQALQGGAPEEDELDEGHQPGEKHGEGAKSHGRQGGEGGEQSDTAGDAAAGPQLSFWGVASALTATVKAKTAEVLTAVHETDWKAELAAFQQGAKEDAEVVAHGAEVAVHKAKAAAEQLPTALEHLPETAGAALHHAEAASAVAREQAERGLAGLAGLGQKLVLGTSDLFDQISHAIQNEMSLTEGAGSGARRAGASSRALASGPKYSRFDADVAAMQRDSGTYCDEPEDVEEFEAWLAGFDLAARKPDIDTLIAENTFMSELQARIVPLIVEYDVFWTRYFYRLHKLEQKHQQFVQLTQRAKQQEEEVGWSSEDEQEQQLSLASPKAAQPEPSTAALMASSQTASVPSAPAAGAAAAAAVAAAAAGQEAEVDATAGDSSSDAPTLAATAATAANEAAPAMEDSPGSGPARTRSSSPPSDDSLTSATAVSTNSSMASGEHWQVVSSPRQHTAEAAKAAPEAAPAAPAAAEQQAEEAAAAESDGDGAGAAEQVAVPPIEGAPTPAAAVADAEPLAAAVTENTGKVKEHSGADDDGELSDWGEEDEAALEAAAAGAGTGDADAEESWGSDWE